jgi:hypothetical protein
MAVATNITKPIRVAVHLTTLNLLQCTRRTEARYTRRTDVLWGVDSTVRGDESAVDRDVKVVSAVADVPNMLNSRQSSLPRSLTGLCSLLVLGGLLAACSSGSSSGRTTMSPGTLAALALKNATAAGWVHETTAATGPGHSLNMTNDIGAHEGRQVIDSDGAHSTVLVLHGMAYINGDSTALTQYFGLQTPNPQGLAGEWISIQPSDQNYSAVSAAVTLRSDFDDLMLGHFSKESTVVVDGTSLTAVHGFVERPTGANNVPATLYVTQTGTVLPVRLQVSTGGVTETTTWSNWGHSVSLATPSQSIPISTVLPSGPGTTA